ncbi:hypothetical protein M569_08525 [Genlisea aurea]|uniref:AB hydrolase-1 domain-containing protein n=1 Tax=Genlisea aurea TaxID=192259 RepID=S8E1R6_9LAMI|nr:hypothetical protein M569_08525 [Genlisea aurea]
MVNLVAAQKPLLHGLMKLAGVTPRAVVVDPETETVINIWVPTETTLNKKKPVIVLVHGFAAEGIVTWQFQVGALTRNYAVYVPDLLFFGGSTTSSSDRSPAFQAQCLIQTLRMLGIERCTVVGFSYGGVVAFKMAEMCGEMVDAMVISGSIPSLTTVGNATLKELGFSSSSELLLPETVAGAKALLKIAMHKQIWFPDRLYADFLQVMFNHRLQRTQLLEALSINNKDSTTLTTLPQRIHLLWGENDAIFKLEHAANLKEKLGEKASLKYIDKAGHLVHLERPCVYNRCLKHFLQSFYGPN